MSGRAITFILFVQIISSLTVWSMRLPSDRNRLYLASDMDQGDEDGLQNFIDFEECAWTKCSTFQNTDIRRICLSLCQKLSVKPTLSKRTTSLNEHHRNIIVDNAVTRDKPKQDYLYRRQLHNIHSCIEALCTNKDSSDYHACVLQNCYGHLHFGRAVDEDQNSLEMERLPPQVSLDSYPMISDTFLESRKVILPAKRGWNDENRNCLKSCGGVDPMSLDYDICIQKCKR